jgi:hypothetical protein
LLLCPPKRDLLQATRPMPRFERVSYCHSPMCHPTAIVVSSAKKIRSGSPSTVPACHQLSLSYPPPAELQGHSRLIGIVRSGNRRDEKRTPRGCASSDAATSPSGQRTNPLTRESAARRASAGRRSVGS